MLRMWTQETKSLVIKKLLNTCDETNIASKESYRSKWGVFINKIKHEGVNRLRFGLISNKCQNSLWV